MRCKKSRKASKRKPDAFERWCMTTIARLRRYKLYSQDYGEICGVQMALREYRALAKGRK